MGLHTDRCLDLMIWMVKNAEMVFVAVPTFIVVISFILIDGWVKGCPINKSVSNIRNSISA